MAKSLRKYSLGDDCIKDTWQNYFANIVQGIDFHRYILGLVAFLLANNGNNVFVLTLVDL